MSSTYSIHIPCESNTSTAQAFRRREHREAYQEARIRRHHVWSEIPRCMEVPGRRHLKSPSKQHIIYTFFVPSSPGFYFNDTHGLVYYHYLPKSCIKRHLITILLPNECIFTPRLVRRWSVRTFDAGLAASGRAGLPACRYTPSINHQKATCFRCGRACPEERDRDVTFCGDLVGSRKQSCL